MFKSILHLSESKERKKLIIPGYLLIIIAIAFIFLLAIGVNIPVSIAIASSLFLPFIGRPFSFIIIAQRILQTFDKDALFAIFFFVAMGNILLESKMADVIVEFVNSLLGRLYGGLAIINIVSSTIFGALTGSVTSTIAAIGGITIPQMAKKGYSKSFATAVASASGINGAMIPPSINGLTYAIINNLSVAYVFLSTLIPGMLYALFLSIVAVAISKKRKYRSLDSEKFSISKTTKLFLFTLPAMLIPILLIVLIYGGMATPTESGAVITIIAILIAILFYRTLNISNFKKGMITSCVTAGVIMFLVATSFALAYAFSMSGITRTITDLFLSLSDRPNLLLFVIVMVLLALGTILEAQPIIIIFSPIVNEILIPLGYDPIHVAGVYVFACLIGLMIPPVAAGLATACAVGNEKMEVIAIEQMPFLLTAILTLLIITYIPDIVLFLPRLLGYAH